jgi:serine/threonine protein kinase
MTRPPNPINGWNLLDRIGKGGQSHVWRATQGEGTETRALKLLRLTNRKKARRFAQEARVHVALSSQDAPHVIKILDHNLDQVENGAPWGYLVLPLAECSLDDVKDTLRGRLELCLEVFEEIVEGAAVAHRAGVVHRDLKPANILFPDRTLKNALISDFGICFLKSDEDRVTSIHETVGAKYFMAPEQERGGIVDVSPAADVYALGKLLCFMLTGRYVYREEYAKIISEKEIADEPRLEIVRDKLLSATIVDPVSERLPDANALLEVVREVQRSIKGPGPEGPSGPGRPEPREMKTAFDDYTTRINSGNQKELDLESEALTDRFQTEWTGLLPSVKDEPAQAEDAARRLVLSQTKLIAFPLAVARLDEANLFPSVKALIEKIYSTTEATAGYPAIIGVPHVLSGFIYMSCSVMALKARSWRALKYLLSTKLKWHYQSDKPLYSYGFDHPYLFHSHAFGRRADKIHDFFREIIVGQLQPVFGLDEEKLTNRYLQTQMLMCIRGAQLLEQGEDIAMYADFGRFYSSRVEELLEEMRGDSELADGLSAAFGETPSQFLDRLTDRLKIIRSEMWQGNYIWRSIKEWHPEERIRNLA